MTVETETILIKLLEELKADVKETNRKLDRVIDDVNEVKVTQARQEEQIKAIQKGQDEFKGQTESAIKELSGDIKGRISIQTYWFLGIITFLVGFLGKIVFWPTHNP